MIGFGKMHNYKGKIAGLVIAGIGLLLWLVNNFVDFEMTQGISSNEQGFLFWWISLFGLYLAAFSKEKNDDERVKMIRAKSMLVSFNLAIAFLLSISITSFIGDEIKFDASDLLILPTFCIMFYLLFFHIGMHFDNLWNYNDEDYSMFNPQKGGKKQIQVIIFIVITALLLGLAVYQQMGGG